jgi:hypothetical protein
MSKSIPSFGDRLSAAADYVRDCHALYRAALESRNELIVNAIDAGYPGHQAARDTQLKQPHIIRIVSQSQPDVYLPPPAVAH